MSIQPVRHATWLRDHYSADVSVVIVNYNACTMLERTLETLYAAQPRSSMDVIVVDNNSRDGSQALVHERFPQVRLIANPDNAGLVRANNQGMLAANGRYIFLLNNDTILYPDTVDALVRYLDVYPRVGAVGGKVLNIDGSIQGAAKAAPTPMAALFGRHSPITKLWPSNPISRRYLIDMHHDFTRPIPVASMSSCALLVRREAIAAAGLIDERYFVYWSDVDWCRAIWEAGYEIHCIPDSVITHDEHKGGTRASKQRSRAAIIDFHRGAYIYFRKWHVRRTWAPMHGVAIVGLTLRAALVLAAERVRWARRARRGVA
jgi:GT2 family glycosyltransferase